MSSTFPHEYAVDSQNMYGPRSRAARNRKQQIEEEYARAKIEHEQARKRNQELLQKFSELEKLATPRPHHHKSSGKRPYGTRLSSSSSPIQKRKIRIKPRQQLDDDYDVDDHNRRRNPRSRQDDVDERHGSNYRNYDRIIHQPPRQSSTRQRRDLRSPPRDDDMMTHSMPRDMMTHSMPHDVSRSRSAALHEDEQLLGSVSHVLSSSPTSRKTTHNTPLALKYLYSLQDKERTEKRKRLEKEALSYATLLKRQQDQELSLLSAKKDGEDAMNSALETVLSQPPVDASDDESDSREDDAFNKTADELLARKAIAKMRGDTKQSTQASVLQAFQSGLSPSRKHAHAKHSSPTQRFSDVGNVVKGMNVHPISNPQSTQSSPDKSVAPFQIPKVHSASHSASHNASTTSRPSPDPRQASSRLPPPRESQVGHQKLSSSSSSQPHHVMAPAQTVVSDDEESLNGEIAPPDLSQLSNSPIGKPMNKRKLSKIQRQDSRKSFGDVQPSPPTHADNAFEFSQPEQKLDTLASSSQEPSPIQPIRRSSHQSTTIDSDDDSLDDNAPEPDLEHLSKSPVGRTLTQKQMKKLEKLEAKQPEPQKERMVHSDSDDSFEPVPLSLDNERTILLTRNHRGKLGFNLQPVRLDDEKYQVVSAVKPDINLIQGHLQVGDVVRTIGGVLVDGNTDMPSLLKNINENGTIEMHVTFSSKLQETLLGHSRPQSRELVKQKKLSGPSPQLKDHASSSVHPDPNADIHQAQSQAAPASLSGTTATTTIITEPSLTASSSTHFSHQHDGSYLEVLPNKTPVTDVQPSIAEADDDIEKQFVDQLNDDDFLSSEPDSPVAKEAQLFVGSVPLQDHESKDPDSASDSFSFGDDVKPKPDKTKLHVEMPHAPASADSESEITFTSDADEPHELLIHSQPPIQSRPQSQHELMITKADISSSSSSISSIQDANEVQMRDKSKPSYASALRDSDLMDSVVGPTIETPLLSKSMIVVTLSQHLISRDYVEVLHAFQSLSNPDLVVAPDTIRAVINACAAPDTLHAQSSQACLSTLLHHLIEGGLNLSQPTILHHALARQGPRDTSFLSHILSPSGQECYDSLVMLCQHLMNHMLDDNTANLQIKAQTAATPVKRGFFSPRTPKKKKTKDASSDEQPLWKLENLVETLVKPLTPYVIPTEPEIRQMMPQLAEEARNLERSENLKAAHALRSIQFEPQNDEEHITSLTTLRDQLIDTNSPILLRYILDLPFSPAMTDLIPSLIGIFQACSLLPVLLKEAVFIEVINTPTASTIFRENSPSQKLIGLASRIDPDHYFQRIFKVHLMKVMENPELYSLTKDNKPKKGGKLKNSQRAIETIVSNLLTSIMSMPDKLPVALRIVLHELTCACMSILPDATTTAVTSATFLRCLGAVLIDPVGFGVFDENPDLQQLASLQIVSKVINAVTINTDFKSNIHPEFAYFNALITRLYPKVQQFCQAIIYKYDPDRIQSYTEEMQARGVETHQHDMQTLFAFVKDNKDTLLQKLETHNSVVSQDAKMLADRAVNRIIALQLSRNIFGNAASRSTAC